MILKEEPIRRAVGPSSFFIRGAHEERKDLLKVLLVWDNCRFGRHFPKLASRGGGYCTGKPVFMFPADETTTFTVTCFPPIVTCPMCSVPPNLPTAPASCTSSHPPGNLNASTKATFPCCFKRLAVQLQFTTSPIAVHRPLR